MFYMMRTIVLTIIVSACKNTVRSLIIFAWLICSHLILDFIHKATFIASLGVRRSQLQRNENAGWIGHGISWRWASWGVRSIRPIGFSRVNSHFFATTSRKLSWRQYKMFSRFYRWISDRRMPSLFLHRFISLRSSHLTKKRVEVLSIISLKSLSTERLKELIAVDWCLCNLLLFLFARIPNIFFI